MKLKVIHSIIHYGYIIGYDDGIEFIQKSRAIDTRREAQKLCDKWQEDIETGLIPNYDLL